MNSLEILLEQSSRPSLSLTKPRDSLLADQVSRYTVVQNIPSGKGGKGHELVYEDDQILIQGVIKDVKRLFVKKTNDDGTSAVFGGWIVSQDVFACMICSSPFMMIFRTKHHCSPDVALIQGFESYGLQRCCVQCYWGQAMVIPSHTTSSLQFTGDELGQSGSFLMDEVYNPSQEAFEVSIMDQIIPTSHSNPKEIYSDIQIIHEETKETMEAIPKPVEVSNFDLQDIYNTQDLTDSNPIEMTEDNEVEELSHHSPQSKTSSVGYEDYDNLTVRKEDIHSGSSLPSSSRRPSSLVMSDASHMNPLFHQPSTKHSETSSTSTPTTITPVITPNDATDRKSLVSSDSNEVESVNETKEVGFEDNVIDRQSQEEVKTDSDEINTSRESLSTTKQDIISKTTPTESKVIEESKISTAAKLFPSLTPSHQQISSSGEESFLYESSFGGRSKYIAYNSLEDILSEVEDKEREANEAKSKKSARPMDSTPSSGSLRLQKQFSQQKPFKMPLTPIPKQSKAALAYLEETNRRILKDNADVIKRRRQSKISTNVIIPTSRRRTTSASMGDNMLDISINSGKRNISDEMDKDKGTLREKGSILKDLPSELPQVLEEPIKSIQTEAIDSSKGDEEANDVSKTVLEAKHGDNMRNSLVKSNNPLRSASIATDRDSLMDKAFNEDRESFIERGSIGTNYSENDRPLSASQRGLERQLVLQKPLQLNKIMRPRSLVSDGKKKGLLPSHEIITHSQPQERRRSHSKANIQFPFTRKRTNSTTMPSTALDMASDGYEVHDSDRVSMTNDSSLIPAFSEENSASRSITPADEPDSESQGHGHDDINYDRIFSVSQEGIESNKSHEIIPQMEEVSNDMKWMNSEGFVAPHPGHVLKIKQINDQHKRNSVEVKEDHEQGQRKWFINICHHESLPQSLAQSLDPSKDQNNGKKEKGRRQSVLAYANNEDLSQQQLHDVIFIYIGAMRHTADLKGSLSVVCDVALNTSSYMNFCGENKDSNEDYTQLRDSIIVCLEEYHVVTFDHSSLASPTIKGNYKHSQNTNNSSGETSNEIAKIDMDDVMTQLKHQRDIYKTAIEKRLQSNRDNQDKTNSRSKGSLTAYDAGRFSVVVNEPIYLPYNQTRAHSSTRRISTYNDMNSQNTQDFGIRSSEKEPSIERPKALEALSQTYRRILNPDESIIFSGTVSKKSPFGLLQTRILHLTDKASLLYLEPKSQELRGEIKLELGSSDDIAIVVNKSSFDVISGSRTFHFVDKTQGATVWVDHINLVVKSLKT